MKFLLNTQDIKLCELNCTISLLTPWREYDEVFPVLNERTSAGSHDPPQLIVSGTQASGVNVSRSETTRRISLSQWKIRHDAHVVPSMDLDECAAIRICLEDGSYASGDVSILIVRHLHIFTSVYVRMVLTICFIRVVAAVREPIAREDRHATRLDASFDFVQYRRTDRPLSCRFFGDDSEIIVCSQGREILVCIS